MQYRILKELPQGQQPGTLIELNEDQANVFLLVEAIEPVAAKATPRKREYARRDLQAEP